MLPLKVCNGSFSYSAKIILRTRELQGRLSITENQCISGVQLENWPQALEPRLRANEVFILQKVILY